jgi:serine protease DegQ
MRRHPLPTILIALALVGLVVTGCITSTGAAQAPAAALAGASTAPVDNVSSSPTPADSAASSTTPTTAPPAPSAPTNPDPFAPVVNIVKQAQPSVVTVLTENALGSGIIYSADGYIVTNNHVVASGSTYTVAFASGEQVPATLVGTDPATDVAVLKVDKTGLPAATFEQDLPQVGQLAVAIGSPLGFENTVTVGIVSGLQRTIPGSAQESQALVDLIQTDAAISPGNSGGALVDAASKVMGMNVAYIPPSASAVSIGFAIPAQTVTNVADDLIAGKPVQHAFLGIRYGTLTPQVARQYNINADHGLIVLEVQAGSPAAQAGLRPGDVILSFDGHDMNQVEDLIAVLHQHAPGDTVPVVVERNNQQQTLQVTLGNQ